MSDEVLLKHLGGHHNRNKVDIGTLEYLIGELKLKSLVDVGCGLGGTIQLALDRGLDAIGIDGDFTINRGNLNDKVLIHDYTKGIANTGNYDLAWSVEFLEHVESQFMSNFFDTFKRCKYVFCTHAVPRQPGYHHVNCQLSEYWISKFKEHGFELMPEQTKKVRAVSTHKRNYIRDTGMVFKNINYE